MNFFIKFFFSISKFLESLLLLTSISIKLPLVFNIALACCKAKRPPPPVTNAVLFSSENLFIIIKYFRRKYLLNINTLIQNVHTMYKILIIGYGSIGEKHHKLLKSNKNFIIKILTDRKNKKIFAIEREQIAKFDPDYIIISSYTSMHGKDLKYVDRILKNKKDFGRKTFVQ